MYNKQKISKADYSPKNVAPLIEFFTSILKKTTSDNDLKPSEVVFKYKYYPKEYLLVKHPDALGIEYSPPLQPSEKSEELKKYEEKAKKSLRLERWKEENDVQYDYFL